MEQAENQDCQPRAGLKTEKPFETVHIVEGFVYDGKTDDGIDDIRVRVDASQDAAEQRDAVANREQAHVLDDIFQFVQKEDDSDQEQKMIVARHHVFRAEIQKGRDRRAGVRLHEHGVPL